MRHWLMPEPIEARARPPRPPDADTQVPMRRRRSGPLASYLTPKEPIPRAVALGLIAVGFAVPVALWSILTYGHFMSAFFLPSPTTVLGTLWTMLTQNNFLVDIWASTYRIFLGFAISAVVGVPLGILIGSFRSFQALFEHPISFARYLPASAFIPLLIVWLGLGDSEKVAIIIIGWAWTYLIVAELVAAQSGIGYVILEASRFSATDQIIAGILTIGVLGLITDTLFRVLHRLLFPYVERIER